MKPELEVTPAGEQGETDANKNVVLRKAIDKAVAGDPTRFTTRSFAVLWNEGHGVRLISRSDSRQALSIPWHDIDALRAILDHDTSKGYSRPDLRAEVLSTAAPALYEALTGLLRVARLSSWAHVTNGPCECKDCAIADATAALALVDGPQEEETSDE